MLTMSLVVMSMVSNARHCDTICQGVASYIEVVALHHENDIFVQFLKYVPFLGIVFWANNTVSHTVGNDDFHACIMSKKDGDEVTITALYSSFAATTLISFIP